MAAAVFGAGPANAQISGDSVRIALFNDQSGPYSDNGGPVSAMVARMAIRDFGGTVLGKKIDLTVIDDQNKPDVALARARQLVDQDGIDTIITGSITPIALGLHELAKETKKPLLVAGSGTSEITGKACSIYGFQFVLDSYALSKAAITALLAAGKKTFYFVSVDYAFGQALERDSTRFILAGGGQVVGSVRHALNSNDFASQLLQAQASKAQVLVLANAGNDFANSMKQASEFGITAAGQVITNTGASLNVIHAIGLDVAKGLQIAVPFYWDANDETRAWSKKFTAESGGKAPNFIHAGTYSAVMHYLKAVQAAGTDDGERVAKQMRATPINDFQMKNVPIREDGQAMRPLLLVEVKKPSESKYAYDYYTIKAQVAPEDAWRPVSEGGCPLAMKN
jgi:branched-chain amino acid transport system substrate-binding protein